MLSELLQAMLIDIRQANSAVISAAPIKWMGKAQFRMRSIIKGSHGPNLHARRTPRNLPPFSHAFKLPSAIGLRLAHHVVIIVRFAPGAYEEGSAQ